MVLCYFRWGILKSAVLRILGVEKNPQKQQTFFLHFLFLEHCFSITLES
jgi:hypothetical protein